MLRESKKNFLIDILFLVTVCGIGYFVFKFLAAYLLPFVIGIVIATVAQKPTRFMSKHTKVPKGICSVLLVLLIYVVVATLLALICYLIYSIGAKIAAALPSVLDEIMSAWNILRESLSDLMINIPGFSQNSANDIISGLLVDIGKTVTGWLPGFAASVALGAPEYLIITTVTIVASCYFAKDYDKIAIKIKKNLKPKHSDILFEIKDILLSKLLRLIKSYGIIMIVTFVELSIGLLIIGVDNALLVALLIAVVDILPVLGCGTVLIPWGIISFIQANYFFGVGLFLLYAVILIIRNIIEPKIVGDQVGMHPIISLLAIFIGYRLIGILGVFLLPIMAITILELYNRDKLRWDVIFSH